MEERDREIQTSAEGSTSIISSLRSSGRSLRDHPLVLLAIIIATAKIWLTLGLHLRGLGLASTDDRLFLVLAQSLIAGDWLGPYNEFTLVKGPFYPIWIALCFYANVPLLIANQLFYITVCAVTILALRRFMPNPWFRFFLFVVLVCDPTTFSDASTRAVRNGIYPSLALLVFACLIGVLSRCRDAPSKLAWWSGALGIALTAFWTTREEGVWLVPSVILMLGSTLAFVVRDVRPLSYLRVGLILLPLAVWGTGVLALCMMNYHHYGIFNTVEFKNKQFRRATGALMRVEHDSWNQMASVPQETRRRIYAVSPTFAEFEPLLEGSSGKWWGETAEGVISVGVSSPHDIRGGWFIWAFRDAAAKLGYHESAPKALNCYSMIADEIDAACDDGRLNCGRSRTSVAPPLRIEYIPMLAKNMIAVSWKVITWDAVRVIQLPTFGDSDSVLIYEDMARARLSSRHMEGERLVNQADLDDAKINILARFQMPYRIALPVATAVACIAYLFAASVDIRRRKISFHVLIATGIIIALVTLIALLSYISVVSFNAIRLEYTGSLYPLIILFCGIMLAKLPSAVLMFRSRLAGNPVDSIEN